MYEAISFYVIVAYFCGLVTRRCHELKEEWQSWFNAPVLKTDVP